MSSAMTGWSQWREKACILSRKVILPEKKEKYWKHFLSFYKQCTKRRTVFSPRDFAKPKEKVKFPRWVPVDLLASSGGVLWALNVWNCKEKQGSDPEEAVIIQPWQDQGPLRESLLSSVYWGGRRKPKAQPCEGRHKITLGIPTLSFKSMALS